MIESYVSGPLAQLAEQGPFKPLVTGSSPVRLIPGLVVKSLRTSRASVVASKGQPSGKLVFSALILSARVLLGS